MQAEEEEEGAPITTKLKQVPAIEYLTPSTPAFKDIECQDRSINSIATVQLIDVHGSVKVSTRHKTLEHPLLHHESKSIHGVDYYRNYFCDRDMIYHYYFGTSPLQLLMIDMKTHDVREILLHPLMPWVRIPPNVWVSGRLVPLNWNFNKSLLDWKSLDLDDDQFAEYGFTICPVSSPPKKVPLSTLAITDAINIAPFDELTKTNFLIFLDTLD